jgi:hypothetical protein
MSALPGHARRGALLADGMVYAITILENYSRALLASSVTRRQDLINAFLSVLYRAIQHYGPPEAFVTDSGSIFLANRAQAIGTGRLASASWRSRRDNPGRATLKAPGASRGGWPTTTSQEPRTGPGYSKSTIGGCTTTTRPGALRSPAPQGEGKRSPSEVLSWVRTPRYQEEDLARAFFSARYTRTLDDLGYLILQRFRLYAEEGLAGTEVAVWVAEDSLTVEYGGEALCRYEVECEPANGVSSAPSAGCAR